MNTEWKQKDFWDIIDIIFRALMPIVIGGLGLLINATLTTETRDADLLQRFNSTYYFEGNQNSRRLSIYYIRLIDNKQTRYELRQFVIWDTLERNVTNGFIFNPESQDWHMVGDAVFDMAEDNSVGAKVFWCDLKSTTLERWPSQETELSKLFDWIDNVYKKDVPDWVNCS
jgi:hypothetical protein